MTSRAVKGLFALLILCTSSHALSGYRTLLDPRSMAMGGTGAASATKFNASLHNPALIAFNRGSKLDRVHISASLGARELYSNDWQSDLSAFQNSGLVEDFDIALGGTDAEAIAAADNLREGLRGINLEGYRKDETSVFSLLVDTLPVTLNFYTRRDIRELTTIRNRDEALISEKISGKVSGTGAQNDFEQRMNSTVDNTYIDISEFGVSVATTNVISYNMPISWGFTPKLIEMRGSHRAENVMTYNPSTPPDKRVSKGLLEWNLDIGFSMLMTEQFLRDELGLSGAALDGEWIFSFVGMNLFPTDFTPYKPVRRDRSYPGSKRAVQALYQFGVAHYRRDYMLTMDIDLTENEVYDFEGLTRFLSMGGEYFWRDNFHLRGGMRFNLADTSGAAKDKAVLTGGFLYTTHGLNIEAGAMINDVEMGGTVGFSFSF
jgi:F plasmid transfer operon, TraF, protein